MAVVVSVFLAASVAIAAPPTRVVIEAFEGDRPADAASTLAPVYAELTKRGYLTGPAMVAAINERVSRDPGSLTATQIVEAQGRVSIVV